MKLHLNVCRWFDKTFGNTYHNVQIIVDDDTTLVSGWHYGGDSCYQETVWKILKDNGLPYPDIVKELPRIWAERVNVQITREILDIKSKKKCRF